MKIHFRLILLSLYSGLLILLVPAIGLAQINTGSDGSDGAFNPTKDTVINMADHPNGIYQYSSISIPANVTVTFIPNANNTPVYWLVQGSCVINGTVDVTGQSSTSSQGARGGPGGYQGGNGQNGSIPPTSGQGPGGGSPGNNANGNYNYGNSFLIPLLGGSGAGGGYGPSGGGGGGGAILIAASSSIILTGNIRSDASGAVFSGNGTGGGGSGGAVRLVASQLSGNGQIYVGNPSGRVRFDSYDEEFTGNIGGQFTSGIQPIIIPSVGQLPQLTVTSVGGVTVSASPNGSLSMPDAVISAQQNNPIPFVVNCVNLPLHSLITVSVKPMTGSPVSGTGYNDTGTTASSSATVLISIPRGGGLIYATATTGN